jgi:hypothetical protein
MQVPAEPSKELVFSVELQDPIVHHLQFSTSIVPGRAFSLESHSGDAQCTISGTVAAPVNGVFSFPIRIDESCGPKTSMKGTQTLALILNKPFSGGPVASFIYMRTFKLTESGPSK